MDLPLWVEGILTLILLIWLIFISFSFYRQKQLLNQLFPQKVLNDKDAFLLIRENFDNLQKAIEEVKKAQQVLRKNQKDFAVESLNFLQKVKTLRYNPYNDTGGDQSFSLGMLDGKLNGFILTSLHSRSNTRVYVKLVTAGKSEIELSREEKKLLEKVVIESS